MGLVWNLLLVVPGAALIWLSSTRLETASRRIAVYYGIPEAVTGAVITAVASSFPELSSVIIATLIHGDFELGMAVVVGSAIFNISVIPALAVYFGSPLKADRAVVYRDALFYMVAVLGLLLTFSLAAIYFPVPGKLIRGSLTRGLALIPIALYAVYLFIQYQDTGDGQNERRHTAKVSIGLEWSVLAGCMLLVALGVELLVHCALALGRLMDTPSFLWGLTIVAAATSLPDLFISIEAARQERSVTSLSNVLGSNSFDLLVAVPVGVVLGGATVINFSRVAPMMGCLTLTTIALFVCMRRDMMLHKAEAGLMLGLYVAFVIWMGLESFGVLSALRINA